MDTTTQEAGAPAIERQLTQVFVDRYRELLEGMPEGQPTWITTGGREGGAYGTLEDVTAEEASRRLHGTTIAAHAHHLRWAIDLVNRFFAGAEPGPDWSESWTVTTVSDAAWDDLRRELRRAGDELLRNVSARQHWSDEAAATGALASYGHAAYHLGALRQLKKAARSEAAE